MKDSFWRRLWMLAFSYLVGFYASVLNRFRVVGAGYLPAKGGVLIASNHISTYDAFFLASAVLRHQRMQMLWIPAKEELFAKSLVGAILRSLGAFPVRRGRDVRAGEKIKQLLEDQKVLLFPEGTRHRDGELGKGNRGVGKLIYDSRSVVVPAALSGLNRWRLSGLGQPARVVFGPPVDFNDLLTRENTKETHILIVERLMATIADLHAE